MKRIFFIHSAIILIGVFLLWYLGYPNTIRWMEGISFFSTAPDFVNLQVDLPSDALAYAGAFILQLFRWPIVGALIQAFFAWVIMISLDVAIYRISGKKWLTGLGFFAVAYYVTYQIDYPNLTESLVWCLISISIMLVSFFVKRKKESPNQDKKLKILFWSVGAGLPLVLTVISVIMVLNCFPKRFSERLFGLEYMAEAKDWNGILKDVTPMDSHSNSVLRRFALLALLETDQLKNQMFIYGISGADDMIFADYDDTELQLFNTMFYEALGVENEIIHQMFQISATSRFGMSFRAMRRMIDSFIRQGDFGLAEKYLIVMNSAPLSRGWVKDKFADMQVARAEPIAVDPHDGEVPVRVKSETPLLSDVVRLVDAYPTNRKYVDLLLCGLLASKDTGKFWEIFRRVATHVYGLGAKLPAYYEEALLLASREDPSAIQMYPISNERKEAFNRFVKMMDSNQRNMIIPAFPNTYWAYVYGR